MSILIVPTMSEQRLKWYGAECNNNPYFAYALYINDICVLTGTFNTCNEYKILLESLKTN